MYLLAPLAAIALVGAAGSSMASAGGCPPTPEGVNALPANFRCDPGLGPAYNPAGSQGRWKLVSLDPDWQIQRINPSILDFGGRGGASGSLRRTSCTGNLTVDPEYFNWSQNDTNVGLAFASLGPDNEGCGTIGAYAEVALANQSTSLVQVDSCSYSYSRNPTYSSACSNGGCSECLIEGAFAAVAFSNAQFVVVDTASRANGATGSFTIDTSIEMSAGSFPVTTGARNSTIVVQLFQLDASGNRVATIFSEATTTVQDELSGAGSVNLSLVPVAGGEDYYQITISEQVALQAGDYELAYVTFTTPSLYGDVDDDGLVDDNDVAALALLIGQAQPAPNGYSEFNFDGSAVNSNVVTQGDVDALFDLVEVVNTGLRVADVNGDGLVDCSDAAGISLFNSGLVVGDQGYAVELDVNRDGTLDAVDERVVNAAYYPAVAGDANRDGDVDLQDQNLVLAAFGSSVTPWSNNDLNGDGMVNLQDLNLVTGNSGATCP